MRCLEIQPPLAQACQLAPHATAPPPRCPQQHPPRSSLEQHQLAPPHFHYSFVQLLLCSYHFVPNCYNVLLQGPEVPHGVLVFDRLRLEEEPSVLVHLRPYLFADVDVDDDPIGPVKEKSCDIADFNIFDRAQEYIPFRIRKIQVQKKKNG